MDIGFARMVVLFCAAALTPGLGHASDGEPVAPKPTLNHEASHWLSFRITPEDHEFDGIRAVSHWSLANHSCAPKRAISGSYVEEPVTVPADVERDGDGFIVRVLTDRFEPGACHWVYTGMSADLTRGATTVGGVGATPLTMPPGAEPEGFICNPRPPVPVCFDRVRFAHAAELRATHPDSFYLRLELVN